MRLRIISLFSIVHVYQNWYLGGGYAGSTKLSFECLIGCFALADPIRHVIESVWLGVRSLFVTQMGIILLKL